MDNVKARIIAFYLPQFHPIPENDMWWGKGFTEWTNVGKAKPLFKGHYQPKVPADLGYYDLRLSEIREAQAKMAREAGVEGFMYWHYWFGNGKTLLERPFNEVLESGTPDFPFCLGWANHSWENKTWDSRYQFKKSEVLIEQTYPGEDDNTNHFNYVVQAFLDKRYLKVDEKPIFLIYSPNSFPDIHSFITLWQKLAIKSGLKGIHFVGVAHRNSECKKLFDLGFDAVCRAGIFDAADKIRGKFINKILNRLRDKTNFVPLNKYNYADIIKHMPVPELDKIDNIYPSVVPNFDHSPRSGTKGLIYINSTPILFQKLLKTTINLIEHKKDEQKIVFLRSWNEWAEGNYIEPDILFGHGFLNALKNEVLTNLPEKTLTSKKAH